MLNTISSSFWAERKIILMNNNLIFHICNSYFQPSTIFKEKEMATYSITLAWKIPWTEEHGRVQSMGSQTDSTGTRLNDFTSHYVGCIYIYNCYIFSDFYDFFFIFMIFDHYVMSFIVSFHSLYFQVYIIWYEYC